MSGDTNSLFWSDEVFNGAKIREYAKEEGVNPAHFEIQIWGYDTLRILKEFADLDLFFKGGTCVQSLLPLNYQRFSIDLDFNMESKNRTSEFILSKFSELNEKLKEEGLLIPASETKHKERSSANFVYGRFYPKEFDPYSGTITFYRLLLSKGVGDYKTFAYSEDLIKKDTVSGICNHIKVQVNVKHQPPALKSDIRGIKLKIQKYPEYKKDLQFRCLSMGDLFADKIIAYRNRKAFKDLYDLCMMVKIIKDPDIAICKQKINQITPDEKLFQDVVKAIGHSLDEAEYKRHMSSLPKDVVPLIRDRMFYTRLIEVIEGF